MNQSKLRSAAALIERPRKVRFLAALLTLLAAALALRTFRLDDAILSLDEASSWRVATRSSAQVVVHCAANVHPPAHFLLLKGWMMLCGDSPSALRSLSALLGTLAVGMTYLLVLEAAKPTQMADIAFPRGMPSQIPFEILLGALFAAALVAFSPLQVELASTARMYSMGVFLAASSCWLLLRARRSHSAAGWWWAFYGLSLALLCYTHNYGLFTAAAQGLFIAVDLVLAMRRSGFLRGLEKGAFPALAFAVALCAYSPWIHVFRSQAAEVAAGYWIPPLEWSSAQALVASWLTGIHAPPGPLLGLYIVATLAAVTFVVVGRESAGFLLLLQAALPWWAGIMFSLWSGESILQTRYLAMAQAAYFALLGLALGAIFGVRSTAMRNAVHATGHPHAGLTSGPISRTAPRVSPTRIKSLVAVLLVGPLAYCTVGAVANRPHSSDGIKVAVKVISHHRAADDLVLVSRPGEVNRVRYYLHRAGVKDLPVRCNHNPFGPERHEPHLGSLTADDLLDEGIRSSPSTCWRLARAREDAAWAPGAFRLQADMSFGRLMRFRLQKYAPPEDVIPEQEN